MNNIVIEVSDAGIPSLKFNLTDYKHDFKTTEHIAKLFYLIDVLYANKRPLFEQLLVDLVSLNRQDLLRMVYDYVTLQTLSRLDQSTLPLIKPSEVDKNEKDN